MGHFAPTQRCYRLPLPVLLGYRWPAEQDADLELADEQRAWVQRSEELLGLADEDGIVCIPSVRGELPAGERLLELLAAAYGDAWNERCAYQAARWVRRQEPR